MIVQVIYKKFTPEIRRVVRKLRRVPSIGEIIFSKGERNVIMADGIVIWEEGEDPIEGLYDVKIIQKMPDILPQISG
ncbi:MULTISPECIES: hypothetical protein [Metallosphaera]|uniref:Uncharacterized protein n=1 Tax=Metallosphaera cuprina (strain Ar-4) TaxID=1006006 RepID=F4FYK6_METCR|nr:hypothetical protein [Metallosphaera cuprina]AEB95504.1 conserved hypothetical protein [Metallosphaera cuprina Ar-4]